MPFREAVVVKIQPVSPRGPAHERQITGGKDSFELAAGKYRFVASATNRNSEPEEVIVEAGGAVPVTLVLPAAG